MKCIHIEQTDEIFTLEPGDKILKTSLYNLIIESKKITSPYYKGLDNEIQNTPQ